MYEPSHKNRQGEFMPPIDDSEIKRVLVISAHPDDSDFGAAGTIAQWIKKGIEVAYVFCTNGDQGGEASGFTKEACDLKSRRAARIFSNSASL
jgi:LmbE family N-acetylglucosaminyl deacetylase